LRRIFTVCLTVYVVLFVAGCMTKKGLIRDHFRNLEGKEHLTVVILGNAFFEPRWQADTNSFLRDYLKREFRDLTDAEVSIINSSLPEDTFADVRRRVDMDIISYRPDLVIMMLGLFDSNRLGLSETTFREQLKELYGILAEHDIFVVVLTTIGFRDAVMLVDDRISRLREFNEMIMWEAGHQGFPVIDIGNRIDHLRETNPDEYQSLFKDQILLNEKGYEYIFSYVMKQFRDAYRLSE